MQTDRRRWLSRTGILFAGSWPMRTPAQTGKGRTSDDALSIWNPAGLKPLALADESGALASLSAYRGQVCVMNIWATWCAPCREEMPSLNRLHARLQAVGAQVIAVSMGDSVAALMRFRQHTPLNMPVLVDRDQTLLKTWGVRILPTTVVLDANSRPRLRHVGERNWDEQRVVDQILSLRANPRDQRPGLF